MSERVNVKSGAWDGSAVFVYSTASHLKYATTDGDHGIIRTLDTRIYLLAIRESTAFCIDR